MDAHPLLFASGLPVAASSFATPEARAGNRRAFRLLLAADEEAAHRGMRAAHLRWVVVSPILESVDAMAALAGFDEPFVVRELAHDDAGRPFEQYRPLRPFAESLHTRLLLADGSELTIRGVALPAAGHFRLVLESDVPVVLFGGRVPRYKAFETVPGARITGRAAPGEPIRVELDVESNIGRRFVYARTTRADANGRFALTVPYATEGADTPTHALGDYRLRIGDRELAVRVPEARVQEGGTVDTSTRAARRAAADDGGTAG